MLVMWRLGVKGQNVLVMWRLFGLLVRESRYWRWLGPTWRMDKACWFMVTCRLAGAGKSVLEVVVSLRACAWSLDLSRWGLRRSFAATVSTVPGRWHATGCATGGAMGGSA